MFLLFLLPPHDPFIQGAQRLDIYRHSHFFPSSCASTDPFKKHPSPKRNRKYLNMEIIIQMSTKRMEENGRSQEVIRKIESSWFIHFSSVKICAHMSHVWSKVFTTCYNCVIECHWSHWPSCFFQRPKPQQHSPQQFPIKSQRIRSALPSKLGSHT